MKNPREVIADTAKELVRLHGTCACDTCDKAYCCEYQVEISTTTQEFESIKHLITEKQIDRARKETSKDTIYTGKKVYRCPFLSEDGKCEIYKDRFLVCCGYTVAGNNTSCSKANEYGITKVLDPISLLNELEDDTNVMSFVKEMVQGRPTDVLEEFKRRYL